jgi:hypothetical protein
MHAVDYPQDTTACWGIVPRIKVLELGQAKSLEIQTLLRAGNVQVVFRPILFLRLCDDMPA